MMDNVIVIGIAGGTGCGKSTMINRIKEEFSEKITIISHDFYYKQHKEKASNGRRMILPYITELMKRLRCALRRSSS